ncbi:MAG: hypothetical protein H0U59_08785 [Gemmatimonadaceae bacterium]|nr:hypothetical protein [Gemmatimonadaceae bacterium]
MRLESFYPIIVTDHVGACRDFYCRWFAMDVVFESTWFVLLPDLMQDPDKVCVEIECDIS